jgi:outer membrane protein OmpA-like peptidoglycan-associated protein
MAFRDTVTNKQISRPRARAPTRFVVGVAAMVLGTGSAAAAVTTPADADCDGIANADDACPTEAEDRDGYVDDDGCPDRDNDRDLIADADDGCPDQAEVVNDYLDRDGCPDKAIEVKQDRIELKQEIHFAFNDAEILPQSDAILNEIAEAMIDHPELEVIRIQGHTDDRGSARYNQQLSEDRASSVRTRLVGLGVASTRLVDVGYGERRHLATGTSEAARARNRRVEFMIAGATVDQARVSAAVETAPPVSVAPSPTFAGPSPVITGCVVMSLAASEADQDPAPPVEQVVVAPVVPYRSSRLLPAMSLAIGGGVTEFADSDMRDTTGLAGSWEARFTLGTRARIGLEAAYLGSAQSVDSLGLDQDALLVSNGLGAAMRLNLLTDQFQPYLLAGAAWRQYDVTNADFNTSSLNDEDTVLETPVGIGFGYRLENVIFDARAVYRRVFDNDLLETAANGDEIQLHNWTANLMAGFEF